jgi:flavodoxin
LSKVRIVYATKTKHSKKIAMAMGKALNVPAQNIADHPSIDETDLLFVVGGIYGGKSLPELLDFVGKLDGGKIKKTALVTSCTTKKKGQDEVRKLLEEKEIPVLDEFICYGSFLLLKAGHPNKTEIQEAVDFSVRLTQGLV